MEFDLETLEPLYRLTIGEAGHSYAFYIALKLGMTPAIIERSKEITYPTVPVQPAPRVISANLTENAIKTQHAKGDSVVPKQKISYEIGDCVWIHKLKRTGIVKTLADHRGNMTVQVKKEMITINHKRISLYIEKKQLYPEDYDMDIVFESKDTRKKRKVMGKRHDEHNILVIPEEGK
jgi:DNA mismatch repair protein MutS2